MGERLKHFKAWFFKVRIENQIKRDRKNQDLLNEYNEGLVWEIGGNGKEYGRNN